MDAVCVENCPKEAIKWNPPLIVGGRLARKPTVDFDVESCIFCGECATICPLDALHACTIIFKNLQDFLVQLIDFQQYVSPYS